MVIYFKYHSHAQRDKSIFVYSVSMGDVDIKGFDIENVVDAENEIGVTPIIDTDRITPIWSDDTEE